MDSSHVFDDRPDWDALARYQAGESPPDEAVAVARWLAAHPADAELLASLEESVGRSVPSLTGTGDPDVDAALQRVHMRMDADRPAPVLSLSTNRQAAATTRRSRWAIGGILAAAGIAALMVAVRRDRPASDTGSVSGVRQVAAGGTFTTPVGVRDSVQLPDGSRALLAPSSRLVVSPAYGSGSRDVTLSGTARFAARHDSAAQFTVHAGTAIIRDVGTVFAVDAPELADKTGITVAVIEGIVSLQPTSASREPTLLRSGDKGELRPGDSVIVHRGAVTADDLAWARGALVYRSAPLDVVREDLHRWYGVELRVPDSTLAARRITATFDGASADRVLNTIAQVLGAEVERHGDTAVLRRAAPR
jgi:transmembrane sensor